MSIKKITGLFIALALVLTLFLVTWHQADRTVGLKNYPDPVNAAQDLFDNDFTQINISQVGNPAVTALVPYSTSVAAGVSTAWPGPEQEQVIFWLKPSAKPESKEAVAKFDSEGLETWEVDDQLVVTGAMAQWKVNP
jgi:hypothetical protein